MGSPLSVKSLREDLEVAHDTAERWVGILENLYVCFRIAPFGAPRIRAVKKERKLYLWDWSAVPESGARFENMVASHLLMVAVEAKTGERAVSPAVRYFKQRTGITHWYQVNLGAKDAVVDGLRILPFVTFCREIGIP